MILFIDTETTGLPDYKGNIKTEGQPARVCQVAMLLTDESGVSRAEYSTLIQPSDWKISEGAAKAHGFTDELCQKYGVNGKAVYHFFMKMQSIADVIVAHNSKFDRHIMKVEAAQWGFLNTGWNDKKEWFCTMEASAPIVNLPPTERMLTAGFNKPKVPTLNEALKFLCGRDLGDTAHDAMYDVKACRDIYFELKKREVA